MCGICGIAGQLDGQLIENMLAKIEHRGPDDEGVYTRLVLINTRVFRWV